MKRIPFISQIEKLEAERTEKQEQAEHENGTTQNVIQQAFGLKIFIWYECHINDNFDCKNTKKRKRPHQPETMNTLESFHLECRMISLVK